MPEEKGFSPGPLGRTPIREKLPYTVREMHNGAAAKQHDMKKRAVAKQQEERDAQSRVQSKKSA